MLTDIKNDLWEELDSETWCTLPCLGSKWLGKWTSSEKGYSLMISDGVNIWGEQRDASYVEEKSQEWAACLEAGVEKLAQLFLSQLENIGADIKIHECTGSDNLTLELTASLDDFPYSWLFYLSKLNEKIIERHWTIPIAATMELLAVKIDRLEQELRRKTRIIEDYVPNLPQKDISSIYNSSIDDSIQSLLADGTGKILTKQLSSSSVLYCKYEEKRKQLQEPQNQSCQPHNRPKLKKPIKGAFGNEDTTERQKEEEANRRAQIQSLTQTAIVNKKRRRLNI